MKPFPMEPHEFWPALALAVLLGVGVLAASLIEWRAARRKARRLRAERLGFVRRARRTRPALGWEPYEP
jgi:hypothetical protein